MTIYEALTETQRRIICDGMKDKLHTWKVFEHNGKELFAYTLFGEGEDEEEATIALLAYENHCRPEAIHVHKEVRRTKCLE